MQVRTIIDDYIVAAMNRVLWEQLEDGTVAATIPDCFGIVALGDDIPECARDLAESLAEWIAAGLANGEQLPIIGGIDLNSDAGRALAATYSPEPTPSKSTFYANEADFKAALAEQGRPG